MLIASQNRQSLKIADLQALRSLVPQGAVNERALESPGTLNLDPYGDGWLFKVKAPRLTANAKNLLSGDLARRWMDEVCKELSGGLAPELGMLSQDGGLPVEGIARNLDPSEWDLIARKFFLT